MTDGTAPAPVDVVLLLGACSARLDDEVLRRVRDEVGPDVRFHDGYVFQHLIERQRSVSELARLLGVSQQAASKQVTDLLDRGLIVRRRDPDDARMWAIELSDRGRWAVEAARRARSALVDDLVGGLGQDEVDHLRSLLTAVSDHTGALDRMLRRQRRPETSR